MELSFGEEKKRSRGTEASVPVALARVMAVVSSADLGHFETSSSNGLKESWRSNA